MVTNAAQPGQILSQWCTWTLDGKDLAEFTCRSPELARAAEGALLGATFPWQGTSARVESVSVRSESSDKDYVLDLRRDGSASCDCPAGEHDRVCKHVRRCCTPAVLAATIDRITREHPERTQAQPRSQQILERYRLRNLLNDVDNDDLRRAAGACR